MLTNSCNREWKKTFLFEIGCTKCFSLSEFCQLDSHNLNTCQCFVYSRLANLQQFLLLNFLVFVLCRAHIWHLHPFRPVSDCINSTLGHFRYAVHLLFFLTGQKNFLFTYKFIYGFLFRMFYLLKAWEKKPHQSHWKSLMICANEINFHCALRKFDISQVDS